MRILFLIFIAILFTQLSFGESKSNKKFIEDAFSKLLTDRDLNALVSFDDTLIVYLLKNEGFNILKNQLYQRNSKIIFKEAFKDSLVKRRLLILLNNPTIFSLKNDSTDQNILYRSLKISTTYQFWENGKTSEVRAFDHTISDTVNLELIDTLQKDKNSEKMQSKDKSFFERYFEPAIIFTSSLAIVGLLFFVRSN